MPVLSERPIRGIVKRPAFNFRPHVSEQGGGAAVGSPVGKANNSRCLFANRNDGELAGVLHVADLRILT